MKKLTLKNLRLNKTRTAVTVIGIILSAALMTVVTGVVSSGEQTMINAEINQGGNWTIALKGDFDEKTADDLSQHRAVEYAYEQAEVGMAKFDSKSSYRPFVKLIGISENSFENCHPCELAEGRYPKSADEILLTPQFVKFSQKTYRAGDKITLDVGGRWVKNKVSADSIPEYYSEEYFKYYRGDYREYEPENEDFIVEFTKTYTISGILKTAKGNLESDSYSNAVKLFTGLTFDKSLRSAVFRNTADIQLRLYDGSEQNYIRVLSELTGLNDEQTRAWLDADGTEEEMTERLQVMSQNRFGITDFTYNYSLLRMRTYAVSEQTMQVLIGIAVFVMSIIILSSVFIIRNSFAISITEKTRLYGMLSSVGATPRQIRRNVLFEGFVLGAAGIPLGIGVGVGATALLSAICNSLLMKDALNGNSIVFRVSWLGIALAAVLCAATIFFSVIFTAVRASKISPVEAIRGNRDIKTGKRKSLKTPRLIEKVFGIGGSIAYKNLRRSRKKYRATVVSIVASVALFLSVFSFVSYTFSYSGNYIETPDFNISVYSSMSDNSYEDAENCFNAAAQLDNIERIVEQYQCYNAVMELDKNEIPEEYLNTDAETTLFGKASDWSGSETVTCLIPQLIALDDDSYREICRECSIDYDYAKDRGIICNENSAYDSEGNPEVFGKLMKNPKGAKVKLIFDNSDYGTKSYSFDLQLAGELTRSENVVKYRDAGILFNGAILLNLDWMKANFPADNFDISADILIQSSDPDQTEQDISDLMGGSVWVQNYERLERIMKSLTLVIEIFVYGFILAISLIGITNIFNTITTNMRLRSKELAMLRSIGMTRREFNRMIRLESVFYSAKSLLIGIPLGLLGGWVIREIYSQRFDLDYIFPWQAILISIAAVGLAVWLIMRGSISRVRRQNIVETIRNDNI